MATKIPDYATSRNVPDQPVMAVQPVEIFKAGRDRDAAQYFLSSDFKKTLRATLAVYFGNYGKSWALARTTIKPRKQDLPYIRQSFEQVSRAYYPEARHIRISGDRLIMDTQENPGPLRRAYTWFGR